MILHKFWSAFVAQINKVANIFWEADPIAQMRYEYDQAVEQLKEGRVGLEQYRGLVERVTRQVPGATGRTSRSSRRETKAYLKAGDRTTAAKFALELQKAKDELATNEEQLQMHETAYGNNLKKIQHANEKLIELREKITEVRRRAEDERGGSGDRQALRDLRREPDDRLRRDRAGHPAEDRSEPRQGARRGRSLEQGHRRDPGRRAHAGRSWPSRRSPTSRSSSGLKSPETTPIAQTAKDLGPAAADARRPTDKQTELGVEITMANGQPRPTFYVAVLLVVLGLVGLALWRYGAIGPKSAGRAVHRRRAEAR